MKIAESDKFETGLCVPPLSEVNLFRNIYWLRTSSAMYKRPINPTTASSECTNAIPSSRQPDIAGLTPLLALALPILFFTYVPSGRFLQAIPFDSTDKNDASETSCSSPVDSAGRH